MKRICGIFSLAVLLCGSDSAFGNDAVASVTRDAQRFAECMNALDAACIVALSDVEGYERVSPPRTDFRRNQTRFFAALARTGGGFNQYDVSPPTEVYSGDGTQFAFVPYISSLLIGGHVSHESAYLVAISTDGGDSWKFFDGAHVTAANIREIVPAYGGQPFPVVSNHDDP